MTDDDLDAIATVQASCRNAIKDYERFWYLGHRFESHPLIGYVHSPFRSETLNINSQGFRGPECTYRNAHGNPRIACFGPSALVGIPNSTDTTNIPSFIGRTCSKRGVEVEILNFGLICGRINNEMRAISKFLIEYDIDVVVLLSGYNDGWSFTLGSLWEFQDIADIVQRGFDANRHQEEPIYFFKQAWKAWKRRRFIAAARKLASQEFQGAEKMFRKRRASTIDTQPPIPVFETGLKLYLQFLHQITAVCTYAGKPLVYVFQPNLFSTKKTLSRYEAAAKRRLHTVFGNDPALRDARIEQFIGFYSELGSKACALVAAAGGLVVDADGALAATEGDAFFDECHYLEPGNETIGSAIADVVITAIGR